jgi:hypothetical protein
VRCRAPFASRHSTRQAHCSEQCAILNTCPDLRRR